MSANNWARCPKCKEKEFSRRKKAEEKVKEFYGKISAEEYFEKLKSLESKKTAEYVKPTIREDYEIGIDGDVFKIKYSGVCSECGFKFTFEKTVDL
jgi:hypothetical protein